MSKVNEIASRLIPRHIFSDLGIKQADVDELVGEDKIAQFIDLRLPGNLTNCIRVQPAVFESKDYKVEDNVKFKDEKGIVTNKQCPVTNFIRWRYNDAQDDTVVDLEREKMMQQVGMNHKENKKVSKSESR